MAQTLSLKNGISEESDGKNLLQIYGQQYSTDKLETNTLTDCQSDLFHFTTFFFNSTEGLNWFILTRIQLRNLVSI